MGRIRADIFQMVPLALGFLLIWEWLRPIGVLAEILNMNVFLFFLVILFLFRFVEKGFVWKGILLAAYIIGAVHYLYYGEYPLLSAWVPQVVLDMKDSISSAIGQNWEGVSNPFRTVLFFFLLMMLSYLVHYWLVVKKSILLFFFMSVLFIAILDTFSPYDGDFAIIRVCAIGFFLLGSLKLEKLAASSELKLTRKHRFRWLIILTALVLVSAAIGFYSPKISAQWPDPVPFFKSQSAKFTGGGGTTGKVGYDEDDSRLGGGFELDDSLVMKTYVSTKHYWKVESKEVYTGSGWEWRRIPEAGNGHLEGLTLDDMDIANQVEKTIPYTDEAEIVSLNDYVPYPNPMAEGTVKSANRVRMQENLFYEEAASRISGDNIGQYSVNYTMPIYNVDQLKKVTGPADAVFDPYLQLPVNLPERVVDLARTLTENERNQYDQVKAVETYLKSPTYTYERERIPYPDEGEDFVDQFLFETTIGYCDHFSTSMAVLLRAADIPARWVKGFTDGDFVRTENGKSEYHVTNNNAHSWVEVYFAGHGWVPFEPTKGFTNSTRFTYDNPTSDGAETEEEEETVTPASPTPPQQEMDQPDTGNDTAGRSIKDIAADHAALFFWTVVLLAVSAVFLFMTRSKWIPLLWIVYFRKKPTDKTMSKAYRVLLKQLGRLGIGRRPEQTLRDYSNNIDAYFQEHDMKQLTEQYEKVLYRGEDSLESWNKSKHIWEKMMRRTFS